MLAEHAKQRLESRRFRIIAVLAGLLLALTAGALISSRGIGLIGRSNDEDKIMASRILSRLAAALSSIMPAAAPAQPLPPPPPPVFGANVTGIAYFETTVPFANLMIGSDWLANWQSLPAQYRGTDGSILSLPPSVTTQRFVAVPPTGPEGIEVRCTWSGSGSVLLQGGGTLLASSATSLRFRVVNRHRDRPPPWLTLGNVDPRRPFHDLDCRETRLAPTVRFRPEFLRTLRGFRVLRFMEWQNGNANLPTSWATRHLSTDSLVDRDGVAIETMMALTHELASDPWFVMPWNADDDYIARFARLVVATLPPGRHVYVETANEVWNAQFPVARQAIKEGNERKLAPDDFTASMRRYAQRTGEVMRLWEAAFAGRSGLVRVLSTQHVRPEAARIALSFGDTARHVDALATAPYFGGTFGGTDNTRDMLLAKLSAAMTDTLAAAAANRQVAAAFGKRYIAYEGGEELTLPAQLTLATQMQHDPAQLDLYRRFLAGWRQQAGDVICLYNSVSPPSPYGTWGLAAWEDESLSDAPKLRAVREVAPAREP